MMARVSAKTFSITQQSATHRANTSGLLISLRQVYCVRRVGTSPTAHHVRIDLETTQTTQQRIMSDLGDFEEFIGSQHEEFTSDELEDLEENMSTETDIDQLTDDEPSGAIDNSFSDAEREIRETMIEKYEEYNTEPMIGDVCIDLVTRQPLYVIDVVAESLPEYFDRKSFDLLNYNQHPYMPISIDDTVYTCVFINKLESVHSERKTYDYPRGRLCRVPVEDLIEGAN